MAVIHVDWGLQGLRSLAATSDVLVIVDVLSFSTCVEVAVSRGASVLPCRWRDDRAVALAEAQGAELATSRDAPGPWSLSPRSYLEAPAGLRVVLPSPNGSALTVAAAEHAAVLAGCLRNSAATAQAAQACGEWIGIVAAGERRLDGSLRPGLEDWLGAGAISARLKGCKTPEAQAAEAALTALDGEMDELLA